MPAEPAGDGLHEERRGGEQWHGCAEQQHVRDVPRHESRRLTRVVATECGRVRTEDAAPRALCGAPPQPADGQHGDDANGRKPAPEPAGIAEECGLQQDRGDGDRYEHHALEPRRHGRRDGESEQRLAPQRRPLDGACERPRGERRHREEERLRHDEPRVRERGRGERERRGHERPAAREERPAPRVDGDRGQRDDDGLHRLQHLESGREAPDRQWQADVGRVQEAVEPCVAAEDRERAVGPQRAPEQGVDHLVRRDEGAGDVGGREHPEQRRDADEQGETGCRAARGQPGHGRKDGSRRRPRGAVQCRASL